MGAWWNLNRPWIPDILRRSARVVDRHRLNARRGLNHARPADVARRVAEHIVGLASPALMVNWILRGHLETVTNEAGRKFRNRSHGQILAPTRLWELRLYLWRSLSTSNTHPPKGRQTFAGPICGGRDPAVAKALRPASCPTSQLSIQKRAEDVLQYPAVHVVLNLLRSVDSHLHGDGFRGSVR